MDAYIYAADIYCEDCGRTIRKDIRRAGNAPAHPGKWYASITLNNESKISYPDCIWCSGNRGRSGPVTPGLTALAVARAVRPLVEAEGYPLADWSNPGGWWLFNMRLDKAEHLENKVSRRQFYYDSLTEVSCPVHGDFIQRESEFAL